MRGIRLVAVDARTVDVVEIAALLARTDEAIGLVLLTSESAQRERLARERGIIAMFSCAGPPDAVARRLASAMLLPVWERVTLATVLRVAAAMRTSVTVRVESGAQRGAIWIESGRIVHAERGAVSGPDAVVLMLAEREGDVAVDHKARTKARTVHFDIDVFLSSFDLPDDEPELELVDDHEEDDVLSERTWDDSGALGVLAAAVGVDGLISVALFDAPAQRLLARIGRGVADPFPRACPEAVFWAAITSGRDMDVEDVVATTGHELLLFVPLAGHAGHERRVLCFELDPSETNVSLAKIEARKIAAVDPALHDLVLAFRSPDAEIAKAFP